MNAVVGTDRRATMQPTETIDRSRSVGFSFNGRAVVAHPGDTIVSALAAHGIRAYGQGRRLQTRRGPLTADRFDPNCSLQVDDEPNVPAAHRLAANGQQVRSQHVWPSLDFDLKSVNQRLARMLRPERELSASSAGTFLRPAYRRLLAKVTVGGRLGGEAVPGRARYAHPDVLVAGGGLAGAAAAAAAAEAGASVLLVDADHAPGGWWRSGDLHAAGTPGELAAALASLAEHGGEVQAGAVVVGATADGTVLVSRDGPQGDELLVCRPGHVVLATGAVERSLTFTGNDLPGVMLATGARRLSRLWAVRPGERVLVLAANEHGERVAEDLDAVGAQVVGVLDGRRGATVRTANGGQELEEVVLGDGTAVAVDTLVTAPGWTVDAALVRAAGGRVRIDRTSGRPVAEGRAGALSVVGMLAGEGTVDAVVAHARAAGRQAAAGAARRRLTSAVPGGPSRVAARRVAPPQLPLDGDSDEPHLAPVSVGIVDFPEDVTAFELADLDVVGASRRLLLAGAAPATDARARAELADLARRHPGLAELTLPLLTGTTGPVSPLAGGVRLAALAELRPQPVHVTALAEEHEAAGAALVPAGGGWLDVAHHGDVDGERLACGQAVGVRDVGRAGLFCLEGGGAPAVLAAALAVDGDAVARLEAGRAAVLAGAPTTAPVALGRLDDRTWLLRTEPVDAGTVDERLAAARFDGAAGDGRGAVHMVPLAEGLAGIALLGPLAEACAVDLAGSAPEAGEVSPLVEGGPVERGLIWRFTLASHDVIELRVPSGRAAATWRAALEAAARLGGRAVGDLAWQAALTGPPSEGVTAHG